MTSGPTLTVACTVNGEATTLTGHPMMRLLDALRLHLHLTGTKEGCGEGECGACAVLVDRALVNSCLMPLLHADGVEITTIEGLADGDRLHPVQAAFAASGAAQCGICTPGMVLASVALLERHPQPDDAQIREGLAGNLCRCTGYMRIFDGVRQAARSASEDRLPPDRLRQGFGESAGALRAKAEGGSHREK